MTSLSGYRRLRLKPDEPPPTPEVLGFGVRKSPLDLSLLLFDSQSSLRRRKVRQPKSQLPEIPFLGSWPEQSVSVGRDSRIDRR